MIENVRFVLVRPRNSGNIGASLRAIANFGFRDLAVVDIWNFDEETASLMAASASSLLSQVKFYDSLKEALSDRTVVIGTSARSRRKFRRISMEDFNSLLKKNKNEKIAVLFGSEKTGLSSKELELCDYLVRIDTDPEFSSLNLSQSVVIISYEARRALLNEAPIISPRKVDKNSVERILEYASEIAELSEASETGKKNINSVIRVLFGKGADVSEKEGKILLWFFRHIWWFLKNRCPPSY